MSKKPRRQRTQPRTRIRTYEELEAFFLAFAAGKINLVILVGSHGLAKSRTARSVLSDACWIEGNASPFGMYLTLYRNRNRMVVIDDVDSLYADRNGVRLLKCLCQTETEKRVAWPTASRDLGREGIPQEFTTTSRVVIITNEWKTLNRNVEALEDRGHLLEFEPSAAEVHRKVGEWFPDEEILSFVEDNLHRIERPTMRLYHRALELKESELPWKETVPTAPENERTRLARELLADVTLSTQESRAKEFTRRGGGCRATFFNHVGRIRRSGLNLRR